MTILTEVATLLPCASMPLTDAVRHWAEREPDRPAVTFLTFEGTSSTPETVTYGQLLSRAEELARTLLRRTPEDTVVAIMLGQSVDYVSAFLGCLLAQRVSVPLYAPDPRRPEQRLRAVLAHAAAGAVVHSGADTARMRDVISDLENDVTLVDVDAAGGEAAAGALPHSQRDPHATAYLQYTSGSTRTPAGVMVSDANLVAGMRQLRQAVPIGVDGPVVSWLPFFHDMGLVLTVATVLQAGGHGVYMSPMAFVQRPVRWLRAVAEYRATVTVVPNFGLDFAVGRVTSAERTGLDLSHLQALCNGSEPVRAASLEAFTAAYAPHGFAHEAHMPGYGLAETTLMVSAVSLDEAPTVLRLHRQDLARGVVTPAAPGDAVDAALVVSCGIPMDQEVRVVTGTDTEPRDVGAGHVGEIWVSGPNACRGYHEERALTAAVFRATLAGEPGTWVRTGDLGFLHDGELYVVGRSKDLLIVGGKNHYPADIEATVLSCVPELRQGAVAAFSHEVDQAEKLVVVLEIEPRVLRGLDLTQVAARVRGAIARHHELNVHDIVIARVGAIPKTTSGKLQRRECARRYADGLIAPHSADATGSRA